MTRTIQDLYYYNEFDKIFYDDDGLQERLDNFGLNEYRSWFNDTRYNDIVICVDEWNDSETKEHWDKLNS